MPSSGIAGSSCEARVGGAGAVAQSCRTLATPWTVACQAPLSMGFSRQESWGGLPVPSPTPAVKARVNGSHFAVSVQLLRHLCWGATFLCWVAFMTLCGSVSVLSVEFCWPVSLPVPQNASAVIPLAVSLEIGWAAGSQSILLQICSSYSRSFAFPYKFQNNTICIYQKKKSCWGHVSPKCFQFGESRCLDHLEFSNPWTGLASPLPWKVKVFGTQSCPTLQPHGL